MNNFLEYLKNTNVTICCSDFEELFQFFKIMKDNGYELNDKINGKYNFLINDNKTFEFTMPTYFDNILFPAFRKKINSCDMLWNGMTLEKAHRKMWNDLADNKVKSQREWIDIYNTNNEEAPTNCCFVCETSWNNNGFLSCSKCPLIVKDEKYGCLLRKWDDAEGFEKFRLAHEIANLPWNEADK